MKIGLLKNILLLLIFSVLSVSAQAEVNVSKLINHSDQLTPKVKHFAIKNLISYSKFPTFVKAVQNQNAKNTPLSKIKALDVEWIEAEDELSVQAQVLNNASAKELKRIVAKYPVILEAFLMDNQGAIVGENVLTSDYWQGDEAKWKNAFNHGKGGIDVGKIKFDKSANAQLQQISIPVFSNSGNTIGAITFGLAINRL